MPSVETPWQWGRFRGLGSRAGKPLFPPRLSALFRPCSPALFQGGNKAILNPLETRQSEPFKLVFRRVSDGQKRAEVAKRLLTYRARIGQKRVEKKITSTEGVFP